MKGNAPQIKRGRGRVNYSRYGYFFVAPFFIAYFVFSLYPLLTTFYYSATRYFKVGVGEYLGPDFYLKDGSTVKSADFFANFGNIDLFRNFKDIFDPASANSQAVIGSFRNTTIMWLINFFPQMLLALLLAAWFTNARLRVRGQGAYKFFIYLPNIITAASIAMLFKTLFGHSGPVNLIREWWNNVQFDAGWITKAEYDAFEKINFIREGWPSRLIIAFINFWMWYGHTMIVLIAGILGISPSLYEAAQIDGANNTQIFYKITLPLLKPMLTYTLITSLIGGLQMFDIPKLISMRAEAGLEAFNMNQTVVYLISERVSTIMPDYGMASAIAILLFAVTAVFGAMIFFMMRDKDEIAQRKKEKAAIKAYKKSLRGGVN